MKVLSLRECVQGVTGNNLKRFREELLLTQKEFGGLLGIPPGTIATWERRDMAGSAAVQQLLKMLIHDTYEARFQIANVREKALKMLQQL